MRRFDVDRLVVHLKDALRTKTDEEKLAVIEFLVSEDDYLFEVDFLTDYFVYYNILNHFEG